MDVSVTDHEGRPVRNLARDDFKLFSDGQERRYPSFRSNAAGTAASSSIVFASIFQAA